MKKTFKLSESISRIIAFLLSIFALVIGFAFIIVTCALTTNEPKCYTWVSIKSVTPSKIPLGQGLDEIKVRYYIANGSNNSSKDWDNNPFIELWYSISQNDAKHRNFCIAGSKSSLKKEEVDEKSKWWDGDLSDGSKAELGKVKLKVGFTGDQGPPDWILATNEKEIDVIEAPELNTIELVRDLETSYNFNNIGTIEIPIQVTTHDLSSHRIGAYLKEKNGSQEYYCNECILENYLGSYEPRIEWGGELHGTYEIYAYLDDQEIGPYEVSCTSANTTVLHVDYENQPFGYGCKFDDKIYQAFNVTGRLLDFVDIGDDGDNLIEEFVGNTDTDVKDYIDLHKSNFYKAYLCGVKGFAYLNESTGEVDSIDYKTMGASAAGQAEYSGSLIGIGHFNGKLGNRSNAHLQKVIIHELGHHLGGLYDECPYSFSCTMNQDISAGDDCGQGKAKYDLLTNPHYCEECLNGNDKIKDFMAACQFD